ncbi:hypothetical protein FB451DRAFT_1396219 [Mycena latifolia]|nr:hypothetical protein FB451DRAFT_1396219 [Mycena latifolia]
MRSSIIAHTTVYIVLKSRLLRASASVEKVLVQGILQMSVKSANALLISRPHLQSDAVLAMMTSTLGHSIYPPVSSRASDSCKFMTRVILANRMGNSTWVEDVWQDASGNVVMSSIGLFIHGMYLVLVVLALCFLHQRRQAGAGILGGLIAAICILSTVRVAMQVVGTAIADGLLTYRCYVIWNASRKAVLLPVVLALATAASGYAAAHHTFLSTEIADYRVFYGLALITNLSLTLLTVGRIFYTRRALRILGKTKFVQIYNLAIQLLLESALLYLIFSCAVILVRTFDGSSAIGILYELSATLMNIVPVLLTVRVSLAAKPQGVAHANTHGIGSP